MPGSGGERLLEGRDGALQSFPALSVRIDANVQQLTLDESIGQRQHQLKHAAKAGQVGRCSQRHGAAAVDCVSLDLQMPAFADVQRRDRTGGGIFFGAQA